MTFSHLDECMHIFNSELIISELILKLIYLDLFNFNPNKLLSNQSLIYLITLFALLHTTHKL